MNRKFNFPSNNGGEIKGISDTGIETFAGSPIKGLGREITQNVLDANKSIEGPAILEFQLFPIEFSQIPGSDSLKGAFQRGQDFFSGQKTEKAKAFYREALKSTSKQINMLRISDFNTTGLVGSKERYNTPWMNLTKSSGVSDKKGDSNGSFGIGKFASFTASSIRTVYYNTVDIEGVCAFQGISRLTSFERGDGEITQGTGYFGDEGNKPIFENISLDSSFIREPDQYGTDIYIPCFKNTENSWEEEIITSVIDGFFYSIHTNKLIVRIGDKEINRETLPSIIEKYEEYFEENAHLFYRVLTSKNSYYFENDYGNGGLIKVWILLEDGLHNRSAFIRNTGMKIKERKFPNALLTGAAIVLIEGKGVQEIVIPLENPQHTNWEPKRAEKVPAARRYINGIYNLVKEYLATIQGEEGLSEVDSDVGEYLPLEPDNDDDKGKEEDLSDEIKSVVKKEIKIIPRKTKDVVRNSNDSEGYEFDEEGDQLEVIPSGHKKSDRPIIDPNSPSSDTPGDGYGDAEKDISVKKFEVGISNTRLIALEKEQGRFSLSFVPSISVKSSEIEIKLVGETTKSKIDVISANTVPPQILNIQNGKIIGLPLVENVITRLIITVKFYDYVAMEVKVNGVK